MRILAAATLALATVATPAFAQDEAAETFTGATATAIVGYDNVEDVADGVVFGAALGYNKQLNSFVIGGEVEATFATTKQCYSTFCDEAGRDLYAGVRAGVAVGPQTMIYAKGGYTNARLRETSGGETQFGQNFDGFRLGAGVEYAGGNGMIVRGEYRYSDYDYGVTRQQVVLGLGYRF
jgi:outer membrane immunogenic protein